jgi:tetratricopeptide (TPR) repeat protein
LTSFSKPLILLPSKKRRNLFYAGFVIINLFLSCYYLDIWLTPGATSRAIPVLTLFEDHSLQIDKYKDYSIDRSKINDHYYSDKAPLTSLVVFPFYSLYRMLGLPELKESTLRKYPLYMYYYDPNFDDRIPYPKRYAPLSTIMVIGDIFCGAIPFVLILAISLFAVKKASSQVSPVVVVMLSFYASYLFTYSGTYTGHILSGLFALAGYIFVRRKQYVLSGILVGLAMSIEFTVGILFPVWFILIYLNDKKITNSLRFAAGLIPGTLFIMIYNYYITGSAFTTTYSYLDNQFAGHRYNGFSYPKISALWGITVSAYRGALVFAPVLIVLLWYAIKRNIQIPKDFISGKSKELISAGLKNYLLVTSIIYLLLVSSYFVWTGGWGFGPRHLIPLVIICLYEGVTFLSAKKLNPYFFYIVSFLGLLLIWMDKSTKQYYIPDDLTNYHNPIFNVVLPDFFSHKLNSNVLPVFMFNSNPVMAIYAWPILFTAGLIILTVWYAKLYPARKQKTNFLIPIACLVGIYIIILIPQNRDWKNIFTLDFFGPFDGWKHYSLASDYKDSAESTNDPARKTQYYTHAVSEYKKVIPYSPAFQVNYYYLGLCYYSGGNQDSAIPALKKALELSPKYSAPAYYLGLINFNKAQYDTAISYYLIAYHADSTFINTIINLGACYQNKNNYALAFHYDSLVLKKEPGNIQTIENMAIMHNEIGIHYTIENLFDKAIAEFKIAREYDTNSPNPIGNLGMVYLRMGDIQKARFCFQKAIFKDPKNDTFIKDLADLNARRKD